MLLASIWLARAADADTPLRFDHLTVRDGRSQSWAQAVLKDSRGLMWFGTWDGLDRFDGSAFRVYRNDPEDPHSLGFTSVATLFEDSHGRLWVGSTWGGPGLSLYDRQGDRFRAFPRRAGPARFRVTAIAEDRDGLLWVATDAGLDLFDPERGTFVHFAHDAARGSSLPSDAVAEDCVSQAAIREIGLQAPHQIPSRSTTLLSVSTRPKTMLRSSAVKESPMSLVGKGKTAMRSIFGDGRRSSMEISASAAAGIERRASLRPSWDQAMSGWSAGTSSTSSMTLRPVLLVNPRRTPVLSWAT